MKILLTNTGCNVGGSENFVINMAQELQNQGHEAESLFFNRGAMLKHIPPTLSIQVGTYKDCLNILNNNTFDLIHANNIDYQHDMTKVKGLGHKIVITNHAIFTPSEIPPLPWNVDNCDAYVCCSRWLADLYTAMGAADVQVIYNGIDTERFQFYDTENNEEAPIVAWVGRGNDFWQKRIDIFAAIAAILHRAGIRIWLAEPFGPNHLSSEIAQKLKQSASFWEVVSPLQMHKFYQKIAASWGCVVSTSSFEGCPLALVEAQACGCPVIAPNVYGINECVSEKTGGHLYTLDQGPEQIADTIIKILNDREQMSWRRKTSACFARTNHSLDQMVRNYIKLYQRILNKDS